jgi:hypothetical protein
LKIGKPAGRKTAGFLLRARLPEILEHLPNDGLASPLAWAMVRPASCDGINQ